MAVDLTLPKKEKYQALEPQMKALFEGEDNLIANMANCSAVLREVFGFLWCGFYFVEGEQLVLGPFQGPVACTRLFKGKGVCAAAWERNEAVIVPDVEAFPGHVACSSSSKSEIVLPVRNNIGEVIAVLDVDSDQLNDFDAIDHHGLEAIIRYL